MEEIKTKEKKEKLSRKYKKTDFVSDQAVRWCPGCGDYAVLSAMQRALAKLDIPRENHVFVSGIGCASRFPYYMKAYGFHTVHGRAATVASGVALARPELCVWVIMGDGDALSIGLGHSMHLLRRNIHLNVIVLNNQIYGLTKGQHSPSSPYGKITRSSPFGNPDRPIDPISLAYASGAGFIARSHDKDIQGMEELFQKAAHYKGTAFIEIYQNCNIFNDGAYDAFTGKKTRDEHALSLEDGKPLVFGKQGDNKAIAFNSQSFELKALPYIEETEETASRESNESSAFKIVVHREKSLSAAKMLGAIYAEMTERQDLPTAFGLFRNEEKTPYFEDAKKMPELWNSSNREEKLQKLLRGPSTWHV